MLFFTFQAPDVALSEIVVSGIGLPLIILAALRKIRQQDQLARAGGSASRASEPPRPADAVRVAGPGLAAVLADRPARVCPRSAIYHGIYGLLDRPDRARRCVTRPTSSPRLNFDIRAFDTLGEEFILFASVAGVALLLRQLRA